MNFLVFTPVVKTSAIGRMAALVVREMLALGHQVTVVGTECMSLAMNERHDFGAVTLRWQDLKDFPDITKTADHCIYQIGNSFEYHEGGVHWLPILPGIVCLHDFFIGHLFFAWAMNRREEAIQILQSWYGEQIAERYFMLSGGASFIQDTHENAPLTEWLCSMALAVVCHSEWGVERVLNSCPGPVKIVPLAYDVLPEPQEMLTTSFDSERVQLLTVGHVNPNKRAESVITAIGASPILRASITYTLMGRVLPAIADTLKDLADHSGVDLRILGEVDSETLASQLSKSDIVSCLRWPCLEGASATAIEAMLYGKPVVVSNAGFYAEIPDYYVIKISPDNEVAELSDCLERMLKDRQLFKTIGLNAQAWAGRTFVASNYAAQLVELAGQTARAKPVLAALSYFADTLSRWSNGKGVYLDDASLAALSIFDESATEN